MRLFREPLFHFFVFGFVIFAWFAYLNPSDPGRDDAGTIVIDDQDVRRLIDQFQASWRRPPTQKELEGLLVASVREEVLVREAIALGLDRGDGVLRNRLMQKMEFLTTSVAQSMQPEDAVLMTYMEQNPESYTRPGRLAFEQIGFGQSPDMETIDAAKETLARGADPASLGEHSLLPTSAPLSHAKVVDSTFGQGFYDALKQLPEGEWAGPVQSGYGLHLARVTARELASLPSFESARDQVLFDWRLAKTEDLAAAQYESLKAQYEVQMPDLSNYREGRLE